MFLLILVVATDQVSGQQPLIKFQRSAQAMGTTFSLTFYSTSETQADQVAQAAFKRIDELNLIFSDYLTKSEVSRLAQNSGKKIEVSDDLWYLMRVSKTISKQSDGAFDISVGPLTKLWRHAIRQQQYPDSIALMEAKQLVNYRWIKMYRRSQRVKLKKSGMKLDFGGIAKGYAIDQAYQVLVNQGIKHALVDGGGDLFVGTAPDAENLWDILNQQGHPLVIPENSGVASSGDSYRYLEWDGSRYSHIIDPERGAGLKDSSPVTIMAGSATIADALASAVSVMRAKDSERLLKKYRAKRIK
jgi:thiamine biosynthesis lipoprotein